MKTLSNKQVISIAGIIIPITIILILFSLETYVFYPLRNDDNAIVITPIFTASAYQKNGFYDYYNAKCSMKCLTVEITNELSSYETNKNAIRIFNWNDVKIVTDLDVHKNPKILSEYKTVILLHNEYVTKEEFNAITSHKNVIYLYPNSLYAEVKYNEGKITLIRGHNYPENHIKNGFDWKHDNSEMEYDSKCNSWNFYKITNGYMLNCYPEHKIKRNIKLLEKLDSLL